MTERKPPSLSFESWVERQITSAAADGVFDELDGAGKPLADIDRPRDELWWVRQKLRREGVDHLPPALAIRRTHDQALRRAAEARSEAEVRAILEPVDREIRHLNSHAVAGPPTTLAPIDIDAFVARWRSAQPAPAAREPDAGAVVGGGEGDAGPHRRRWRRRPWRRRQG